MLTSLSVQYRQHLASLGKRLRPSARLSRSWLRTLAALALLALLLRQTSPAYAIGCSVTELVDAINSANASASNDVIALASGCTYDLTAVNNAGAGGANGLPIILNSGTAGSLTINGNGATIRRSTGGAVPEFRIFLVNVGANLTLNNLAITNGRITGDYGAAISNFGQLLITQVRLFNNWATSGGAVFNFSSGVFTAVSSEISGNTAADFGGGIANFGGAIRLINSTISGNSALSSGMFGGGGAIDTYAPAASTFISGSTIANNTAANATRSGIWIEAGTLEIRNSILANNSGANNCVLSPSAFIDGDTNLDNGTTCGFSGAVGQNINPLLGTLSNNGGFTRTHALLSGSPALNVGTDADAKDQIGAPLTTDQRGSGFPRKIGTVDIGAYERACPGFPYTVPAGNVGALITAISCANHNGVGTNDVINLTNSTYTLTMVNNTLYGATGLPLIVDAALAGTLTINGNGAIIERSGIPAPPSFRLLYIEYDGVLTLNNLTLRGGMITDVNYDGGAIANRGYLTLNNSVVTNNQTARGGGGIWSNGTLTLNNADVTDNSANFGGGIVNENTLMISPGSLIDSNSAVDGGGIYNWVGGILTVDGSTISGNEASGGHGGGIMTDENGSVTVQNDSTISGNTSGEQGGGIYVGASDTFTLNNSTVSSNSSVETGGGIYNLGNLTVTNSTISGNDTGVRGGGIFNNSVLMEVSNSTITGNSAVGLNTGVGGGIDSEYDSYSVIVTNSTIARNTARDAGAINAVKMSLGSNIIAENTALGGLSGGFNVAEQYGEFYTMGYNVFKILSGSLSGYLSLDLYNENATPLNLGALAENGGPTQTLAIGAGSVAIGHGLCQWPNAGVIDVSTDQRGVNRKTPCDSGAFETINTPPTISNITDKSINANTSTGAIAFTINDAETAASSLTLSGLSSNTTLVPNANITFGGSGTNRTVTVTPAANQTGTATITVTVSDGSLSANDTFLLTVSAPPDAIFSDGFETGNLSAWSSKVIDGGDLAVIASAQLTGSTYGMRARINDLNDLYVQNNTPNAEPRYRARFYFDPNTVTMANNDRFTLLYGYQGASTPVVQIEMRKSGTAYQLRAGLRDDAANWTYTSYYTISDAPHIVEIDWQAATAAAANDGRLRFWIDQNLKQTLGSIDNDTRRVDTVRLGAVTGIDAGTSGVVYFDAFRSTRTSLIGAEVGGLGMIIVPEPGAEVPPAVTDEPTRQVTDVPTVEVTPEATPEATGEPTIEPSATPTAEVTPEPSATPSVEPTVEPTLLPFSVPVFQTMDDGAPLWSASAGWLLSADAAYSGLGWQASASGNTETLTFKVPVDLAGASAPTLSFQSKLVSGSLPEVQVSTDGAVWQTVSTVTPSLNWALVSVDLSAYAGQTVRVQFVWASPSGAGETWQVDEVTVSDGIAQPPIEPTLPPVQPTFEIEPTTPNVEPPVYLPTTVPREGGAFPGAPADLPPAPGG